MATEQPGDHALSHRAASGGLFVAAACLCLPGGTTPCCRCHESPPAIRWLGDGPTATTSSPVAGDCGGSTGGWDGGAAGEGAEAKRHVHSPLFSSHPLFPIISFFFARRLEPLGRTGREQRGWHRAHGKIFLIVVFFLPYHRGRKAERHIFFVLLFFLLLSSFLLLASLLFLIICLLRQEVGPTQPTGRGVQQQAGQDGTGRDQRGWHRPNGEIFFILMFILPFSNTTHCFLSPVQITM